MPLRAFLLRLVLSVVLVFNGTASAMASVRMAEMHARMADAPARTHMTAEAMAADHVMPPCHDEGQPVQERAPVDAADDAAPDCCKSDACTCACIGHFVVTVPAMAFHGAAVAKDGVVLPIALGHPAPALPDSIRPPIG